MKNIRIAVDPYVAFQSPGFPPPQPFTQPNQTSPAGLIKTNVQMSVQFDDERDALEFADFLIEQILKYKSIVDSNEVEGD